MHLQKVAQRFMIVELV